MTRRWLKNEPPRRLDWTSYNEKVKRVGLNWGAKNFWFMQGESIGD